jgi:hypothetical protein
MILAVGDAPDVFDALSWCARYKSNAFVKPTTSCFGLGLFIPLYFVHLRFLAYLIGWRNPLSENFCLETKFRVFNHMISYLISTLKIASVDPPSH